MTEECFFGSRSPHTRGIRLESYLYTRGIHVAKNCGLAPEAAPRGAVRSGVESRPHTGWALARFPGGVPSAIQLPCQPTQLSPEVGVIVPARVHTTHGACQQKGEKQMLPVSEDERVCE